MRVVLTAEAAAAGAAAPPPVRKAFYKQLAFLERDLHHPSLHAKKYDESRDRWQARVNRSWRFYFTIQGDCYIIQAVTPHPNRNCHADRTTENPPYYHSRLDRDAPMSASFGPATIRPSSSTGVPARAGSSRT